MTGPHQFRQVLTVKSAPSHDAGLSIDAVLGEMDGSEGGGLRPRRDAAEAVQRPSVTARYLP
jgi:hypothetical protein